MIREGRRDDMKKQYLITERAHFMCPNMHFGMLVEIDKIYNKDCVEETLSRMAEAHPFLRSLIAYENGTNKLYYKMTNESQVCLKIKENKSTLWEEYKKISKQDWDVFKNGLLKVYIYPTEKGITILFIAHHLLVDGRGLLELVEEFANDYVGQVRPSYVEEQLIESIDDLPAKSKLSGISKMLIKQANRRWAKENKMVSYDTYKNFVEVYSKKYRVDYQSYEVDENAVGEMRKLCKENGFTMNDLLMAQMYLRTGNNKIIIAADIRKTFSKYKKGSLGNFSTAMGIVCKTKTVDLIQKAKEVHQLVQKRMKKNRSLMLVLACYFEITPTLLDAAAISALGGFESKAGSFVGGGMFGMSKPSSYSITNLGKVENSNIKSLMFIPPASPATKLTLGVITLNGTMKACSSKNEII